MMPGSRILWNAAVASVHLPATSYRLAAHLSAVAVDGTGMAWASRRTLALRIGCDEARLKSAFRAMEEAGFLVRGDLDGPSGRQTYRWKLTIPGAEVAPRAESAPGAEVAPPGGAEVADKGGRKSPHKRGRERGSKRGSTEGPSFALRGGGEWQLPDDLRDTLAAAYPDRDLDAELAKAAAWCATEPGRRKRPSGMGRFLRGWLGRAKPSETTPAEVRPQPSADALAFAAEIEAEIAKQNEAAHV